MTAATAISNPYATIPCLSWLGRIKLAALPLATVSALPFFLLYLATGTISGGALSELRTLTFIFLALHILTVASWAQRARGNLDDIVALQEISQQAMSAEHASVILGNRSRNLLLLIVSVLLGGIFHFAGRIVGATASIDIVVDEIIQEFLLLEGPPLLIFWNFVALLEFFVIGVAIGFGIVTQLRQNKVMTELCSNLAINLLNVDQLAVVGGPILRALAAPVFLLAASGPILFANNGASADGFYLIALPMALLLTGFALTALPPVLTVRRKVIDAKQKEMDIIQRYLSGEKEAMQDSQISHLQESFSAVDVLDYRDRIIGIWEWPLHGQLLKLLFYLFIPPLAWAAAALVERVIDAALG